MSSAYYQEEFLIQNFKQLEIRIEPERKTVWVVDLKYGNTSIGIRPMFKMGT